MKITERANKFVLRGMRWFALVPALSILASCGSVSSEYIPRDPNRTSLVMQSDKILLVRGGRVLPVEDLNKEPAVLAFFGCDPAATQAAKAASSDRSTATVYQFITVPLVLLGGLPVLIPLMLHGKYYWDSHAELLDAVNLQNDSPYCLNR